MRRMKNLEKKKAWERWVEFHEEIAARENAIREQKVAIVLKRIMHGTTSRVFTGWHLIIQRNKRFFRKQQALKRATAAGDTVIRQKRKTLVAIAWRAWKYQMVDQDKLASVKQMLSKRLSAAKGTYLARWWAYVRASSTQAGEIFRRYGSAQKVAETRGVQPVDRVRARRVDRDGGETRQGDGVGLRRLPVPHHEQMARTRQGGEAAKDGDAAHGWAPHRLWPR